MATLTVSGAASTPVLSDARITLDAAGPDLWRVRDRPGHVLGHLRIVSHEWGLRYRAERLNLATASFHVVGAFWSPDDAIAALRNS